MWKFYWIQTIISLTTFLENRSKHTNWMPFQVFWISIYIKLYLAKISRICILCFLKNFLKFYLLIHLWLCWVFIAVWELSLVAASGGSSLWQSVVSVGTQAQLPHSIWNPPGLGIKPMSPALTGSLPPLDHHGSPAHFRFVNTWEAIMGDKRNLSNCCQTQLQNSLYFILKILLAPPPAHTL